MGQIVIDIIPDLLAELHQDPDSEGAVIAVRPEDGQLETAAELARQVAKRQWGEDWAYIRLLAMLITPDGPLEYQFQLLPTIYDDDEPETSNVVPLRPTS